jgi:hypothetical protein
MQELDFPILVFHFLFRGGKLGLSILGITDVCLEYHLVLDYCACSVAVMQVLLYRFDGDVRVFGINKWSLS